MAKAKAASKEATAAAATGKPKSKGRQRIAMALIVNKARRQVSFSKRKAVLLNMARELALRCGAHVAVILFSGAGKAFTFGSPSVDDVLRRLTAPLPGEDEPELARVEGAAAEPRKEEEAGGLAGAPRALEPWHQSDQTQMPGNGGGRLTDVNGFQNNATGMGTNAMDNANGYLYQNPHLAGDHYYQYFTDDMAVQQAPRSNVNAGDDAWPNLCGIDDWSCDAVVPAEYPYRSMDLAAGSTSYKPAGDNNFTGVPALGQGCCNFIGENRYDYDTQCLLNGDLLWPDTISNCFRLEQLNYLSDVAQGFVF